MESRRLRVQGFRALGVELGGGVKGSWIYGRGIRAYDLAFNLLMYFFRDLAYPHT